MNLIVRKNKFEGIFISDVMQREYLQLLDVANDQTSFSYYF